MYLLAEKKEENPNYMYFFTQSITVVGWSSCKFKKDEDGNSVIQEEELDIFNSPTKPFPAISRIETSFLIHKKYLFYYY